MAFVSEMVDQLRLLLDDATDLQVAIGTKKLWLNRGILMLWPNIYRIVVDTSVTIAADTYEYALPVAVANGYITSLERETANLTTRYVRWEDYDIISGDEDQAGILRVMSGLPETGVKIRIRYAAPISTITASTYANMQSETWVGPDRILNLPVLYAASMITSSKLDNRQDHTRYSTMQAQNGVADQDLMAAAQMWMGQFELELDKLTRPLPIVKD